MPDPDPRPGPSPLSMQNAQELSHVRSEQVAQRALLERIDERTLMLVQEVKDLRRNMISRPEFNTVRAIAYGLMALLATGVVAALLRQVIVGS